MTSPLFQYLPTFHLPNGKLELKHGNQGAKCWVLAESSDLEKEENILLLKKILGATKVNWDSNVCLIGLPEGDSCQLIQELPTEAEKQILIFGLKASSVGYQLKVYMNQVFTLGRHHYLFSQTLEDVKNNQTYKKQLWLALQQMFGL